MRTNDKSRKARQRIKLIGAIIVSIALIWLIKLTVWSDFIGLFNVNNPAYTDASENVTASQQRTLLMQDEVLHGYLNALQKLDKEYVSFFTDTTNKNGLMEMNDRIKSEEASFSESIDSISKAMISTPNLVDENLFANMINSFRLALENRRAISNLREALSNGKAAINPDKILMLKVKNELLSKESKIANLENTLKEMQIKLDKKPVAAAPPLIAKAPETIIKSPVNNTDEENLLKEKLLEKENKIAGLTNTNNLLQKEFDRVAKLYADAKKNLENNDSKSKNSVLENKVDELNTELRLAQVDCNLARADASQIISNSKQRRLLLSEALSILNSFSKSDNSIVQKKVQDKMVRLNQVAKNYRE